MEILTGGVIFNADRIVMTWEGKGEIRSISRAADKVDFFNLSAIISRSTCTS